MNNMTLIGRSMGIWVSLLGLFCFLSCSKIDRNEKKVKNIDTILIKKNELLYLNGKTLFEGKCINCHNVDTVTKVAKGLQGMSDKFSRSKIKAWIHGQSDLVLQGDTYASKMHKQFDLMEMPHFPEISCKDVDALIYYIDGKLPDNSECNDNN